LPIEIPLFVIANQFGNGLIVIISLPLLIPPPPKEGEEIIGDIPLILPLPLGGGGNRWGRVYLPK